MLLKAGSTKQKPGKMAQKEMERWVGWVGWTWEWGGGGRIYLNLNIEENF